MSPKMKSFGNFAIYGVKNVAMSCLQGCAAIEKFSNDGHEQVADKLYQYCGQKVALNYMKCACPQICFYGCGIGSCMVQQPIIGASCLLTGCCLAASRSNNSLMMSRGDSFHSANDLYAKNSPVDKV
jgi:hypothetical protein